MFVEYILKEHSDGVTENDRIRDFHHGRLHVQREQDARSLRSSDLASEEVTQCLSTHESGVEHFTFEESETVLQYGCTAIRCDQFDLGSGRSRNGDRLFVIEEIAGSHARDSGLGIRAPCTHTVWVILSVLLHGTSGAAVGVPFTQNWIHRTPLDLVVGCFNSLLFVGRCHFWIFWKCVAFCL